MIHHKPGCPKPGTELATGTKGDTMERCTYCRAWAPIGRQFRLPSDRTQEVARVVVDSTGPAPSVSVEPWQARGDAESGPAVRWRPTGIMEQISRHLEASKGVPVGSNALFSAVKGKDEFKRLAVAELESGGFVTVTPGTNRTKLHASVKPYRQADDPTSDAFEPRDALEPPDTAESAPIRCGRASRSYTGTRDAPTGPPLGAAGTHLGRTWDALESEPTEPPENLPNAPSTAIRHCDCGQPLAAGHARCDDCRRKMGGAR